jgi:hypothetical protein
MMTDMKEEITKAVSDNIKDLLVQLLEKQQPKQEVTIKEEKQEKYGEKDVYWEINLFCDLYIYI